MLLPRPLHEHVRADRDHDLVADPRARRAIAGASIPIGRPIANTTVFVLDPAGSRVPFGAFGELHIGGEGVARGYHDRPELTAERFVDRPGMGRVYATGDVVRIHPRRRRRVRRARRQPGEDPRSPHRARRDRGGARRAPGGRPVRRGRSRQTTATPAWSPTSSSRPGVRRSHRNALREHVAEILPDDHGAVGRRSPRRVPAHAERQDRSQGAARRRPSVARRRARTRSPRRPTTTPRSSSPASGPTSSACRSGATTTSSTSAATRCSR